MKMSDQEQQPQNSKMMHVGMWVCCAVMLLPLLVFFARGGSFFGLQDILGVLAPIALCLGAHGVMFFFMGKSCHGSGKSSDSNAPAPSKAPFPTSMDA
ncbi:DUF2933 domain-containing protein [Dinoroseobacter sp. PD6]|jgi:hypothetical protein|uniref:DUF2933 domain-containing protein n=1 Tax=Pseudooceanicola nitratireducens TaxID=517719 RepID=A0A1I1QV26_9RHOB|nr:MULTISPECIES: hypothetical protein [Rhodobacterales]MDD9718570.1 DUF2933 domain-containing protein [Dinoroseobacter sp. PD6]SEJ74915.1 hypothetical protein SAMN05216183_10743 [Pseudooceanicola nitratireducens]SFD23728.1 hypothetical protein SAMN05421762_3721 [Pseudooceanicola nitratireducens]